MSLDYQGFMKDYTISKHGVVGEKVRKKAIVRNRVSSCLIHPLLLSVTVLSKHKRTSKYNNKYALEHPKPDI